MGLLTTDKKGRSNISLGRILEIEGLSILKCEQALELSDVRQPVVPSLQRCYAQMDDCRRPVRSTLERRIAYMEEWLANPVLVEADPNTEPASVIDINLKESAYLIASPTCWYMNDGGRSTMYFWSLVVCTDVQTYCHLPP